MSIYNTSYNLYLKKYIHSAEDKIIHFTDLFDEIGLVVYVDDLNIANPIWGSEYFETDYSDFSDDDLLDLSKEEISQIDDLYTIYRLNQLAPELLTKRQRRQLADMYRVDPADKNSSGFRVYMDDSDVARILEMLKKHSRVQGPYYRVNEPEKNFAELHDLDLGPKDYAYILHNLTVEECTEITPYKTFSYSDKEPGNELIVFNVDKEFILRYGQTIGNFKVYIKIDLSKTVGSDNKPIALVSFHE